MPLGIDVFTGRNKHVSQDVWAGWRLDLTCMRKEGWIGPNSGLGRLFCLILRIAQRFRCEKPRLAGEPSGTLLSSHWLRQFLPCRCDAGTRLKIAEYCPCLHNRGYGRHEGSHMHRVGVSARRMQHRSGFKQKCYARSSGSIAGISDAFKRAKWNYRCNKR